MNKKRAFSFIEMLIALTIFVFVGIGLMASFKYFKVTGLLATNKATKLHELRSGLDYMKFDLLVAKRIYVTGGATPATSPAFPASFNTVDNDELVVVLPSVDPSQKIIDTSDDDYDDYVKYYLNASKQLIREVVRSSELGSARDTGTQVLAEGIQALTFSNGVTTLGSLTGWELAGLNYVTVQVSTSVDTTLGGAPMNRSLTMEVIFRNF